MRRVITTSPAEKESPWMKSRREGGSVGLGRRELVREGLGAGVSRTWKQVGEEVRELGGTVSCPGLETLWPRSWHFCPRPSPAEPPPHTLALIRAQSALPQPCLLCHALVIIHCDLSPLLSLGMESQQRPPHLSSSFYIYFFLLFSFFLHFCLLHSPISFLPSFSRPGCQSLLGGSPEG